MRGLNYFILLVILFAAGCVPKVDIQPVQRVVMSLDEYQALQTEGTGIVSGQGFLKTRGGDVKKAAGSEVILNPVTSYSNQWYEVSYLQGKPLTALDPRINQYLITTIADGDGRFTFTNVPEGEYYVGTSVYWESPTGYQGALQRQGGQVAKKIKVINNKETKVILTW